MRKICHSTSTCKLTASKANHKTINTRIGSKFQEYIGGVHQPKSATASTGGGHTAERVEMSDISFSKLSDLSSPLLLQTCASGKTIPKAKFEFFRADGNGDRIKYFDIELENVLIGMVKPHLGGSELFLSEIVNLKFSKVKWRYTQQKIGGSSGGNTAGGWDLATNKIA